MVRQAAVEMLKGIRTTPYENGVTNEAGETRWLMETVAPIQYQGRRAVLGNVLDITERKQNEERLRQTRRRFRGLVNLLPLSVTEIDINGNIAFANRKAIEDSGWLSPRMDGVFCSSCSPLKKEEIKAELCEFLLWIKKILHPSKRAFPFQKNS